MTYALHIIVLIKLKKIAGTIRFHFLNRLTMTAKFIMAKDGLLCLVIWT